MDLTLIAKRLSLNFQDQDCVMINFADITATNRLKQVEENNKRITTLSTSIHHEMLVPLNSNVEFAESLFNHLTQ